MSVFKTIGKPSANRVESRPVECKGLTAYNRSMRAKLDVKSVDDVMKLTIEDVGSELPFELSLTSDDFGATTFNSAKTPWNANSMGEAVFMGITHVFSKHEREPGMWPYVKGGASINRKWSKTVTMKGIAGITTGKVWERRYLLCERITERSAIPTLSVFAPASPWELYQQAEGWMAGVYANIAAGVFNSTMPGYDWEALLDGNPGEYRATRPIHWLYYAASFGESWDDYAKKQGTTYEVTGVNFVLREQDEPYLMAGFHKQAANHCGFTRAEIDEYAARTGWSPLIPMKDYSVQSELS
jgi:hypothetical protein